MPPKAQRKTKKAASAASTADAAAVAAVPTESCPVCYDDVPLSSIIKCPNCPFQCCIDCQKRYDKPDCMECHAGFTHKFMNEVFGKKYVKERVIPKEKEDMITEEKKNLRLYNVLCEWEREFRVQKKRTRFGVKMSMGKRPELSDFDNDCFPCPKKECRGFVDKGKCSVCSVIVCIFCREIKESEEHKCDESILKNILEIKNTTKPCPKCTTAVFRTEGCDHMFCTNCRTHFHWITGKVLSNSTNGHYIQTARFAENIALRNIDETPTISDPYENNIHISRSRYPADIKRLLYTDLDVVRNIKKMHFDERDTISKIQKQKEDANIRFMLGDIDEKSWTNRVYMLSKQKQKNLLIANVLSIYIETIKRFQSDVSVGIEQIRVEINKLIELTNASLKSIHEEYGGSRVYITNNIYTPGIPPIIYGTDEEIDTIIKGINHGKTAEESERAMKELESCAVKLSLEDDELSYSRHLRR